MKISKGDFIKYDESLWNTARVWEIMMPFGPVGKLRFRTVKFTRKEYKTAEELREAVFDLIRGCRFSDTDYYVYCDDKLVTNL